MLGLLVQLLALRMLPGGRKPRRPGPGRVRPVPRPLRIPDRHRGLDGRHRGHRAAGRRARSRGIPAGLPSFIPQVASIPSLPRLDEHLRWPAYATGLRRVFSWRTHSFYPKVRGRQARQVLGLGQGQAAVLACYGDDPLVEAYWTVRRVRGLAAELASQDWDLVLAPNYSIYGDQPRAEHLINMRRSLIAAAELAEAGVPAVPNIYWYRLEDLRRWAAWAGESAPPAVAINAQTVRTVGEWDSWMYPGLCWLAENLPAALPVIITGLSRPDRVAACAALFGPRLTVISQCPYQYASRGAVMTAAGRTDMRARPPDAFAASVRYMQALLTRPDQAATHAAAARPRPAERPRDEHLDGLRGFPAVHLVEVLPVGRGDLEHPHRGLGARPARQLGPGLPQVPGGELVDNRGRDQLAGRGALRRPGRLGGPGPAQRPRDELPDRLGGGPSVDRAEFPPVRVRDADRHRHHAVIHRHAHRNTILDNIV